MQGLLIHVHTSVRSSTAEAIALVFPTGNEDHPEPRPFLDLTPALSILGFPAQRDQACIQDLYLSLLQGYCTRSPKGWSKGDCGSKKGVMGVWGGSWA